MSPIGSPANLSIPGDTTTIPTEHSRESRIKRATGSSLERIAALDFTKGALVLFMVVYHWLNYFHGPHGPIYRYLRFLPPSFIFIAGFLISNAYLRKYDISDPRLPKRLTVRGLKILGIFVILNVAISLLLTGFRNLNMSNLVAVCVTGNVLITGVGKAAAFYILVPISYLLLLSSMLLVLCRFYKYTFYVVCALGLLSIVVLNLEGLKSANLELVTIGLLGLILGYTPLEKINIFIKHPYLLVVAYLGYTVVITLWEPDYPLQVAGVCLTLMLIYLLGTSNAEPGAVRRGVILLGRYPLFGYIAQVAILQLLRRGFRYLNLGIGALVVSFVAALVLTVVAVVTLDRARSKSPAIDRLYKGIFA